MVTLFLVEDEKVSRNSIKDNVPWEALGVEFLGDAPDGEVALSTILANPPDILLTDIHMPFMDGLELSDIVKKRFPETKIIIISGFDDFEYAKKGISIGVTEYILKPVSVQDIIAAVEKAKEQILKEREEDLIHHTRDVEHQALKEEQFVRQLLRPNLLFSEILSQAEALNINIYANYYQIFVTEDTSIKDDLSEAGLLDSAYILYTRYNGLDTFILKTDSEEELNSLKDNIHSVVEDKFEKLDQASIVTRITDIYQSYFKLVFSSGSSSSAVENLPFVESDLGKEMEHFLRSGELSQVETFWEKYEPLIIEGAKSALFSSYIYVELYLSINTASKKLQLDIANEIISPAVLQKEVIKISTPETFLTFAKDTFRSFIKERDKALNRTSPQLEVDAVEYIESNYFNEDLSLSTIAQNIGITPNYLSTLFKEKTGKNIVEYVTEVRINQAKKMLLQSNKKTFEIAFDVGYGSVSHFSTTFKKEVGMSPSQFRKAGRERE